MLFRPVRTSQPQGPAHIDWSNPLLSGGQDLGVLLANNKTPGVAFSGVLPTAYKSAGVGVTSYESNLQDYGTGDATITTKPYGISPSVIWWVGYLHQPVQSGKYLLGDYDGTAASFGLITDRTVPLPHWGWSLGGGATSTGEVFLTGRLASIVIVRDSLGIHRVYKDGVLKLSISSTVSAKATMYVGGIGLGQTGLRASCTTLLAGKVKDVNWTPQQVKSFTDNPWQIFAPDSKALWTPAAASVTLPTLVQPSGTTSAGAWTATGAASLHEAINELVPSDTQYISVNSASSYTFRFAEAAFPGAANQTVAYRASSTQGSTFTIRIFQGATTIMERTHALTSTDTLYTQTLTAGEIALITAGPIDGTLTTS